MQGRMCRQGRLIWGPGVPEPSYRDTSFIVSGRPVTLPFFFQLSLLGVSSAGYAYTQYMHKQSKMFELQKTFF